MPSGIELISDLPESEARDRAEEQWMERTHRECQYSAPGEHY